MLGITFSSPQDLKTWIGETGLTTDLLCDADRAVALAYGAAETADQERATRVSVLIGADGRVIKTWTKPDPENHPSEILGDLG